MISKYSPTYLLEMQVLAHMADFGAVINKIVLIQRFRSGQQCVCPPGSTGRLTHFFQWDIYVTTVNLCSPLVAGTDTF